MKRFSWILLSFFIVFKLQAQDVLVTPIDPCATIDKKSTIIINDNTLAAANTLSAAVVQNNTVNFSLNTSSNTSAGVYNASGNLIRTLWNGVRYAAGNYKAVWSGIMDDGTLAPPGTYQVRILTNNVQYTWEGVIGNTSASLTDNVYKSFAGRTCFASVGTKMFYGQFFYEGGTNSMYFNLNDIQRTYDINIGVHAITLDCATDGNIIVWACADQYQNNGIDGNQSNYIFATKASDNTPVTFVNESVHTSGRENEQYNHFIGWFADKNTISYNGVAINNNFIFATKTVTNQLLVFNKTTGAIAQTLTYPNPGKLAAGSADELWMIVNNVLKKYTVDAVTGALTDANVTIAADNPAYVRISPDNSTVLITDAGTHQVKAYTNSKGILQWALGQLGGYDINGPAVANDKFMFAHAYLASPAIAYQADGSFWVNDMGNFRILHFNADRTYKEQIMSMPSSRSTNADPNNPTRVFCDELEFQRDYSKPLDNGVNGSWKLVKNWKVGTTLDGYRKFNQIVTLSNGHTYATGDDGGGSGTLYDLTATGAKLLRSDFDGSNLKIEADGSLYTKYIEPGNYFRIGKQPLTGFGSNDMPQWGNTTIVAVSPSITPDAPFSFANNTRGAGTNSRYYFSFNPQHHFKVTGFGQTDFGIGYHLGAIKTGGTTWDWQASKSTFFDYHGDYPRNGDFDVGNNDYNLQHSENCQALVNGTNVFWNVNAEFWKANAGAGGANIWNHFNEDGLLIGNFGKTALDAVLSGNTGFAGNAFSTALVKVGSDFYIYHCDESKHAGIHSWHVTGLNTISEQSIPVTVSAVIVPITDPSNLMSGLPYKSTTFNGGNGWTVATPIGLVMPTNVYTYEKDNSSINIEGRSTQIVTRALNNTSQLNNWTLTGSLSFIGSEPTISGDNYNYLELVDIASRVICRFWVYADTRNGYFTQLFINGQQISQGVNGTFNFLQQFTDFTFNYSAGIMRFKIGTYNYIKINTPTDLGGNYSAPTFLRINQGSPGNQNHAISLDKLKFIGN